MELTNKNKIIILLEKYWSFILIFIIELILILTNSIEQDSKYITWVIQINQTLAQRLSLEPIYLILFKIMQIVTSLDASVCQKFINESIFLVILLLAYKIFLKITHHLTISNLCLLFVYFSPMISIFKNSLHRNLLALLFLLLLFYFILILHKESLKKYILIILIGGLILLTHRIVFLYFIVLIFIYLIWLLLNKKKREFLYLSLIFSLTIILNIYLINKFFIANIEGITFSDHFLNDFNIIYYLQNVFKSFCGFQIKYISQNLNILMMAGCIIFLLNFKKIKKQYLFLFLALFLIFIVICNSEAIFGFRIEYPERIILMMHFFIPIVFYFLFSYFIQNKKIICILMGLVLISYCSNTIIRFTQNSNIIGNIIQQKDEQQIIPQISVPLNIKDGIDASYKNQKNKLYTGNDYLPFKNDLIFQKDIWDNIQNKTSDNVYKTLQKQNIHIIAYNSLNYNRWSKKFNTDILGDSKFFTLLFSQATLYGNIYIFKVNEEINKDGHYNPDLIKNTNKIGDNFINNLNGKTLIVNNQEDETTNNIILQKNKKNIINNDNYKYFYFIGKNDAILIPNFKILSYNLIESVGDNYIIFGIIENKPNKLIIYNFDYPFISNCIRIIGYFIILLILLYLLIKEKLVIKHLEIKYRLVLIIIIIMIILN